MANNKRKDLGIGNFIQEVKADQTGTQRLSVEDTVQPVEQPQTPVTPQPTYGIPGRPAKKQSLLSKKLAKLVYIDEETELQLRLIKTFQNFDYKEIIFTAVHDFMDRHYRDMRLDEQGAKKVERIIKEYKTRL